MRNQFRKNITIADLLTISKFNFQKAYVIEYLSLFLKYYSVLKNFILYCHYKKWFLIFF